VRAGKCNRLQRFKPQISCGNPEGLRNSNLTVPDEIALKVAVPSVGEVSALWIRPVNAHWMLVLAHGAGAGMRHPFLAKLAAELASVDIASFRYQFPYMERHRRAPDSPPVLTSTVRAAVHMAAETEPDLPILAGGKSMGGRMTSQAAAEHPPELENVQGLVFFGFPLHPPGRPGTKRAEHLPQVMKPMLFLQGSRDQFADLDLLRLVCADLGAMATLHIIDRADHSFHVLKSSGKSDAEVLRALAQTVRPWADKILAAH
jgi:predicted alpha/beta-hydrolase family hydrolase